MSWEFERKNELIKTTMSAGYDLILDLSVGGGERRSEEGKLNNSKTIQKINNLQFTLNEEQSTLFLVKFAY